MIYIIDLGKLKISIDTGAQQAKQELNDVGETAEKQESKFSKFGGALKKGALIGVGAAAALGAGISKMATKMSDASGEIDDMAQRTGTSAEEFQKLAYAAKLSGMETATLEKALIKQQTAFADASAGNETMIESYEQLGINIKEVGTSSEAFDLVIARLADMEDETQRNAIANDIFGKSYAELTPLLNAGSEGINALKQEAVDLGSVMSNEAVEAGAKFGDSLDSVKAATNGVFMEIGSQFLPILQDLLDWVLENMPEIKAFVKNTFETISEVVGTAWRLFSTYLLPILQDLWVFIEPTFPLISEAIELAFIVINGVVQAGIDVFNGIADAIQAAINKLNEWNNTDVKRKQTEFENGRTAGGSSGTGVRGSHANGLDYVPFDGYIAELHKGERVLTAQEARNINNSSNISITGNNFVIREEADIQKISRELQRQILTKQRGALA